MCLGFGFWMVVSLVKCVVFKCFVVVIYGNELVLVMEDWNRLGNKLFFICGCSDIIINIVMRYIRDNYLVRVFLKVWWFVSENYCKYELEMLIYSGLLCLGLVYKKILFMWMVVRFEFYRDF